MPLMRRFAATSILLLVILPLSAAMFPGYDFTFTKTPVEPLQSTIEEGIALDYTGYGYLGSSMTAGIYLRMGFKAPYESIEALFAEDKKASEGEYSASIREASSFSFIGAIGPAMRKSIGDAAIWYMGLGGVMNMEYTNYGYSGSDFIENRMEIDIGGSLDMGIRINVQGNITLSVGVYASFVAISLDISRNPGSGEESIVMTPNMFLPAKDRKPMVASGYITLGHTFRPRTGEESWRYIVTTPEKFSGTLVRNQDQER